MEVGEPLHGSRKDVGLRVLIAAERRTVRAEPPATNDAEVAGQVLLLRQRYKRRGHCFSNQLDSRSISLMRLVVTSAATRCDSALRVSSSE